MTSSLTCQTAPAMVAIKHEQDAHVPPSRVYGDKFLDSVVVITGAGAGIGEATARLFAQQGAHVVLLDIDEPRLEDVTSSIRQSGGKADYTGCDVSNEHDVSRAVEWTVKTHKKIDVLVNVAGVYPAHKLVDCPTDMYLEIISVNLNGSFFLTRAVLPHMQKAGYGRIIHTSTSACGEPEPGLAPYVTSKAGIVGLVRSTAVEAGPGVTANVIMPGLIDTAHVRAQEGHDALFDHIIAKQSVKRRGQPLDVAHAVSFIASPEASFFSGQIFNCCGGETFNRQIDCKVS